MRTMLSVIYLKISGLMMARLQAVSTALRTLCSDILVELEKPLSTMISQPSTTSDSLLANGYTHTQTHHLDCTTVKGEYHAFLSSTVKFLYAVQERQQLWGWGTESGVYEGVSWMQALWASRKPNSQHLSFIEQQMSCYADTGCFGKKSREVLRRDVEVVEYLNDLMDMFV
ncbi:hypothetical protein MBM_07698 [Drepanopeziza brunnea f. sp. 'multigermtubi' MB_m1]|uniref:Uncharacterized protein n=1 Tax=Marssonina brunnea f. sp. multigermtubi (strain MB_m1) TaxID=1072389 RepID=K1WMD2_MARBU|nr:uncharacterized protein MBM_07698 [Drepanopeziza brunnea f. sp. 'multigermtubi' MB_m1]EKD14021.1 hypothetical protein MBM_07698 [Drepanopeziza brunnea f. sp. 'multigermtubi' MB_m1]